MLKTEKLTPVEWEIMESIWELGGAPSVREVLEHAFPRGEKAYTTVLTIMNILEKKGLLKRCKIGLVNFYEPTKTREQLIKTEISLLASRMFNDSLPAFANYLFNSEGISLKEIEMIREILDKKETELRSKNS
jgi:BlaI family penicillinase repressor